MIGWITERLATLVVEPQGEEAVPLERRIALDLNRIELGTNPQAGELVPITSTPLAEGREQGGTGGFVLRHLVAFAVLVQHGDLLEAARRRDLIVYDLIMRYRAVTRDLLGEVDPATGQYPIGLDWAVDYSPVVPDTPTESATLTFTVDCQVDG